MIPHPLVPGSSVGGEVLGDVDPRSSDLPTDLGDNLGRIARSHHEGSPHRVVEGGEGVGEVVGAGGSAPGEEDRIENVESDDA